MILRCILMLLIVKTCKAFLLDSKDSSAYITVKEFRELMDEVFEEKHYRRILDHNVGTMLQDAVNNKAALDVLGNSYHDLSQEYSQLLTTHAEVTTGLQDLRNANYTISNNSIVLSDLKRKGGYQSAFTATIPYNTHPSGNVRFNTVLTNIGSGYSRSTGAFTCQYPGIYMFTTHLYNSPSSSYDYVSCYILLNGSSKINIYSYPYSDTRYYEASNSIVLELKAGDLVSVGSCSSNTGLTSYSSFSGFLIKPE